MKSFKMGIEIFAMTDTGCVREKNEDTYFIHKTLPLAVVCDGMGGHQGGAVASGMIVDIFKKCDILDFSWSRDFKNYKNNVAMADDENNFLNMALLANDLVYEKSRQSVSLSEMGSTLVALYMRRNKEVCILNVGDSRAYHLNKKMIRQITTDHSLKEKQMEDFDTEGEFLLGKNTEHVITRAVGTHKTVEVDFFKEPVYEGFYLLCSDGLSSMLKDDQIHKSVFEVPNEGNKIIKNLVQKAKKLGGKDNITVILFKVNKESNRI